MKNTIANKEYTALLREKRFKIMGGLIAFLFRKKKKTIPSNSCSVVSISQSHRNHERGKLGVGD